MPAARKPRSKATTPTTGGVAPAQQGFRIFIAAGPADTWQEVVNPTPGAVGWFATDPSAALRDGVMALNASPEGTFLILAADGGAQVTVAMSMSSTPAVQAPAAA